MKNKILIIGGMGPQASLELHKRILLESRKHHNGNPDEYPEITHLSLQIPEFFSSKDNEKTAIEIINMALKSQSSERDKLICMPCNTAHKLMPFLIFKQDNFVSMIDAIVNKIDINISSKVGILASPNTLKSGLFQNLLEVNNKEFVVPSISQQKVLERIIDGVIRSEETIESRILLNEVSRDLVNRGAETILLGCTEFSIVGVDTEVPIIDSVQTLAEAVTDRIIIDA